MQLLHHTRLIRMPSVSPQHPLNRGVTHAQSGGRSANWGEDYGWSGRALESHFQQIWWVGFFFLLSHEHFPLTTTSDAIFVLMDRTKRFCSSRILHEIFFALHFLFITLCVHSYQAAEWTPSSTEYAISDHQSTNEQALSRGLSQVTTVSCVPRATQSREILHVLLFFTEVWLLNIHYWKSYRLFKSEPLRETPCTSTRILIKN